MNPSGYGSFFHSVDESHLPKKINEGIENFTLFYAGRYAIKSVFKQIMTSKNIKTIWLPNYYCPFVKAWLEHEFDNLQYYQINPFNPNAQPDWSLFNPHTDIVLVNNYWGLKQHKFPKNNRPVIVEDHSHGWLSKGALASEADFCIASLRKTVPLPLGGVAWQPKNSNCKIGGDANPSTKNDAMGSAWNYAKSAMDEKAKYSRDKKKGYLTTYSKGETLLRTHYDVMGVAKKHEDELKKMMFLDYNNPKRKNIDLAKHLLLESDRFRLVDLALGTPFGLLLAFKDRTDLLAAKTYLVKKNIFPAELWPNTFVEQEYNCLMNLHMDFRYTSNDVEYIIDQLNDWSSSIKD